ncbi:glycosyltransferase [Leptobacterium flavescens]|uniref:Glycosyltransferase n=1 Tax=Leptobacterium flavescens TaxID=472055 RepID=A0A6P0UQK2_9FLAO|nr:TIGR04283 family arsenosugar biosynthesis glycosyltransferase [Leptobacterium flavescens]NER14760.1 glycosyltransferase [Leptobacterium flavescens]
MSKPRISIIIPVLNEGATIDKFLEYVINMSSPENISEVIVVDGGSIDETREKVRSVKDIKLISSKKGRARQMNAGAAHATGQILYFIHADSYPPQHFDHYILKAYEKGENAGCFRMKFDDGHPVLKFSQWFTRFNHKSCRGGDQSLFIGTEKFRELGGYNEDYIIYEDYDLISRIYKNASFKVIPEYVTTSARRYEKNGAWKLQYHFTVIHLKKFFGAGPDELYQYYKKKVIS